MTVIERALIDDIALDLYLSEVETQEFKRNIAELIAAYADSAAIDRAIEALQSIRTTQGK